MSIEYDEYDLLWLFESEPKIFEDHGYDGHVRYCKNLNNFELHVNFDRYEEWGWVHLRYLNNCVFSADLNEITSLKKHEENLIISVKEEPILKLEFKNQLAVELISEKDKKWYKDIFSSCY